MAGGTVRNAKNQFLTLEFTKVFNIRVHNSPLPVRLPSVVSLQLSVPLTTSLRV